MNLYKNCEKIKQGNDKILKNIINTKNIKLGSKKRKIKSSVIMNKG